VEGLFSAILPVLINYRLPQCFFRLARPAGSLTLFPTIKVCIILPGKGLKKELFILLTALGGITILVDVGGGKWCKVD